MKSIKRLSKLSEKNDSQSLQSREREGMYYQFLIERKVPTGIIRHIASNEDVVTYEFMPNNYVNKRRKLDEALEPNSELLMGTKDEFKDSELATSSGSKLNGHQISSFSKESIDLKASLKAKNKDLSLSIKNQIRSNLNLDYNKPWVAYKRSKANQNKLSKITSPAMKKSVSHGANGDNLFHKHSSSRRESKNLKYQTKHYVSTVPRGQPWYQKCSDPSWNQHAKYFVSFTSKAESHPVRYRNEDNASKRSKSVCESTSNKQLSNMKVTRNPNIKYIKANELMKHEIMREQQFEKQISQLIGAKNGE